MKLFWVPYKAIFFKYFFFFPGSQSDKLIQAVQISKKELFDVLKSEKFFKFSLPQCKERLFLYILEKLRGKICSPLQEKTIKSSIKVFLTKLISKWKTSHHIYAQFITKNAEWLGKEFKLPELSEVSQTTSKKNQVQADQKKFLRNHLCVQNKEMFKKLLNKCQLNN